MLVNCRKKQKSKILGKVKPVPDFLRIHQKWEKKLSNNKEQNKKPLTEVSIIFNAIFMFLIDLKYSYLLQVQEFDFTKQARPDVKTDQLGKKTIVKVFKRI